MAVIVFTNAVVYDLAVMVERFDTPLTDWTVPHGWSEDAAA